MMPRMSSDSWQVLLGKSLPTGEEARSLDSTPHPLQGYGFITSSILASSETMAGPPSKLPAPAQLLRSRHFPASSPLGLP